PIAAGASAERASSSRSRRWRTSNDGASDLRRRVAPADRSPVDLALAAVVLAPALALGRFLNVVAPPVPVRRSIVHAPSAGRSCAQEIRWYDNVPLVSYAA